MRLAVLGDNKDSFIKPMSLGLIKMCTELGVEATYYDYGLAALDSGLASNSAKYCKNIIKIAINKIHGRSFQKQDICSQEKMYQLFESLREYNAVVVVSPIPTAFDRNRLRGIELLRKSINLPIVLFQNYYLPIRGAWLKKLQSNKRFKLDRYDWYLAASTSTENPISLHSHPVSHIGHNLSSEDLHQRHKKSFKILVDFPIRQFKEQHKIQIAALKNTNTEYTVLSKHHTINEIRKIYREHSGFFISRKESFGLAIVENQLCGNHIYTPEIDWCPGHFLEGSNDNSKSNKLGRNFVHYDNCITTLQKLLVNQKSNYDPNVVVRAFTEQYPHFNGAKSTELRHFLNKISRKEITHTSHRFNKLY